MERKGSILTKVTNKDIKNGTFIIPKGIKKIGNHAFELCLGLKSIIIPKGVTEIGLQAFYGCHCLISVIISNGVKKIGYGAFEDCLSLKNIIIPESVIEINTYAFSNCENLTDVISYKGVTKIESDIFCCCNLQKMNIYFYETLNLFDEDEKPIIAINSIKSYCTGKIKYKEEDINKFKEYIKEHKKETYSYIVNDIDTLHFVFDNMVYSFDDIDSLIKMTTDTEIRAILLKYSDKLRSQKSIEDIFNEKYDLDKYLNENLDEKKPPQKRKK